MSNTQTKQSKGADFRSVVERANGTIHTTKVIFGFLTWFIITATLWLALFAVDNLLDLPTALRFPFAISGLAITVGSFFKCFVGAFRKHQSDERVALMLEEQFGIEENVLINTMQFEEMGYSDKQKEFIFATANAAKTGWSHVPLRQLWQPGRMVKWCSVFAVLLVLWIGYGVAAPHYLENAFARYTFSFDDTPPAASASLVMTPNEDLTIAEYEDLEVTLDVTKFADGEPLMVYPAIVYREGTGRVAHDGLDGAEVKMRPVVGNPNLYTYTFETVRRSFAFRIFVGGTYTRSVQVTVNSATKIVESVCKITPPAYIAQAPHEQSGPPYPVKCLPASQLDVLIRLDKPVESLQWQWPEGVVAFQDAGKQVWKAKIEIGAAGGNYDLVAIVKGMKKPIVLSSGSVLLQTDRKPDVRFTDMEMSHALTPGATLRLRFEGKDDYGMKDMRLTLRPAKVGSQPKTIREWSFGETPGKQGRIEKKLDLSIDASVFEPGNKYFLEVRGDDFCTDTDSGVSDAMLITVKKLETNLASGDESDLKDLYAALEHAIVIQKNALEATQKLTVNIDNVWLDVNRVKRADKDIQSTLEAYRKKILDQQISVRETLTKGVQSCPDASVRMARRMRSIADVEGVEANSRASAAGRTRLVAGDLRRANGYGPGSSFKAETIQNVRFKSQPARYVGLVISSTHGWTPRAAIEKLSVVGEKDEYIESAGWKLVSSSVRNAKEALTKRVTIHSLPASFVFDMGKEQPVTGVACQGGRTDYPKGISVYLTSKNPPRIVAAAPDKKRVVGEYDHLKTVQEAIYNQLLALKGAEFEQLQKAKEDELAKLLGESGEETAASITEKVAEVEEKIQAWDEEFEENEALRKVLTSKSVEDLTEEEEKTLSDLELKKEGLKRELEEMEEDLARFEWDSADPSEVELFEITLHNIQDKLDKMGIEDLDAFDPEKKPTEEMTHNMESSSPQEKPMELDTAQQSPKSGELKEPGHNESGEDDGRAVELGELPAELPLKISELTKGLEDLGEPVPESGSELDDHNNPAGAPVTDNLDSASAAGQMSDQTPNPKKKTKGRGNVGRAGQADGQMVASKAPAVPDNEVAMSTRMSDSAGETGEIQDEDSAPASAVGVGKGTGIAAAFADSGKLPPDALKKLKEMMGDADSKSLENTRGLFLALNSHNLPTTDLKRAIEMLRQIQDGKQGVDVRQTMNAAIKHMRAAEKSLARAYELRAQQIASGQYNDAHDSNLSDTAVPAGYENMVGRYFKAVAEESDNKK